jgi:hypothetical protein
MALFMMNNVKHGTPMLPMQSPYIWGIVQMFLNPDYGIKRLTMHTHHLGESCDNFVKSHNIDSSPELMKMKHCYAYTAAAALMEMSNSAAAAAAAGAAAAAAVVPILAYCSRTAVPLSSVRLQLATSITSKTNLLLIIETNPAAAAAAAAAVATLS